MDRLRRWLSRISIRLLAFNLLLVFLPVFGILSLETYERQLLGAQERSMVQQIRVLTAALSERGDLDEASAEAILVNMRGGFEARLRVLDRERRVLADSSRLGPQRSDDGASPKVLGVPEIHETFLYRAGRFVYGVFARFALPPEAPRPSGADSLDGPEIERALRGGYGSDTRASTVRQRSLTLYTALPIFDGGEVVGVVQASKTTYQILSSLYELRLDTFKVVLASVLAAAILSLFVSTTIARPLRRLRREARALLDRRGRLRGRFQASSRRDEIGDLSRALAELTRRLEGHIEFIESFASDVSHEFKNPLAAIRSAVELIAEIEDPAERQRFAELARRDVSRLEHLLSGVREITRIDTALEAQAAEDVDLANLLRRLVARYEMHHGDGVRYRFVDSSGANEPGGPPPRVTAAPERLGQVFENLLDNATSFSPTGGTVEVHLATTDASVVTRIADQGPGFPEEHLERAFARFFTYRPEGQSGDGHTGLGLAIVRTLVEGYGGTARAVNRKAEGGAELVIELPRSSTMIP